MNKFYQRALGLTVALAGISALSANAQLTLNPGSPQTVTINKGTNFAVIPSAAGEFTVSLTNVGAQLNDPSNVLIFSDPDGNNPIPQEKKVIFEDEPGGPLQSFTASVDAGVTYYIYYNYWMNFTSSYEFTLSLTSDGQGSGPSETPEDITLTLGVPTKVLKGQKAYFNPPVGADTGTHLIRIATNSTTLIEGKFVYDQYGISFSAPTAELTPEGYVYLQGGEAMAWAPFYILQDQLDEVTVTVTIPDYDEVSEITPVELDKEFSAVKDNVYSFTITDTSKAIGIQTDLSLDYTNALRYMLYKDEALKEKINPSNDGNLEDGVWTYLYMPKGAGTYYFHCQATGDYTITQIELVNEKEPFEGEAVLVAPLPGVEQVYSFVVTWNVALDENNSFFLGEATITNPSGMILPFKPSFTPQGETSTTIDAVSLNIDYDYYEYSSVSGVYTVTIPQGYVVDMEGNPNPKTVLTYNLSPTAGDEDDFEYFSAIDVTFNLPEGVVLNTISDFVITYPFEISYIEEDQILIDAFVNGNPEYGYISGNSLQIPVYLTATNENIEVVVRFNANQFCKEGNKQLVNPTSSYNFTLVAANQPASFNPGNNSVFYADSEDYLVTVTWNSEPNFNVSLGDDDDPLTESDISLKNSEGVSVPLTWYNNFDYNEDNTGFVFDLKGLEPGKYTITIPQGVLVFAVLEDNFEGGVAYPTAALNSLAVSTYEISAEDTPVIPGPSIPSGIETIMNDSEITVYNLQGLKVNKDNLKPGLYIVNGQKVVIK